MRNHRPKAVAPDTGLIPRLPVFFTGIVLFLAETVFLPGAYSPFRLPKMTTAIIGLGIIAGVALSVGLWRGRITLAWGRFPALLLLLPVLQACSAVWAASPDLALQTAVTTAAWVIGILWMASFTDPERWHVVKWAASGAAVSALVLLAQWAGVAPFVLPGYSELSRFRLTGLAGNPSDLAMAGILMLPLLLPSLLEPASKRSGWILPTLFTATAVLGQTLTGFFSITLLTLGMLIFARSRKAWIAVAILILPGLIVTVATPLRDRVEAKIESIATGDWYFLLSAREDGLSAATTMVRGAPITGVGAGNFSREFFPARLAWLEANRTHGNRGELSTHFEWAHNDPLQLTAELGAIGLAWMVAFLLTILATRSKRDPQLVLAALAWVPFLFLHYPTHLAVGLVPASLFLSYRLRSCQRRQFLIKRPIFARALAATTMVVVLLVAKSEVERLQIDLWRGIAENALASVGAAPEEKRVQVVRAVEAQIGIQMHRRPQEAGWLWRMAGRTRLSAQAYPEAETAFRRGAALDPHEEAEMGLGLALAGQGRMSEALHYLTRACRLNITLAKLITQSSLRETVRRRLVSEQRVHRPKSRRPPGDNDQ